MGDGGQNEIGDGNGEFEVESSFNLNHDHPLQHQQQMGAPAAQFNVGDQVEVTFERDEAYGVWFPATVNKCLSDNSYLVQYWRRKDGTAEALLLKSTVSSPRIRPLSPLCKKNSYELLDTVDAFYDFAWTTGVIIKEFNAKKFMVSFKRNDNVMVLSESKLRVHMDWVNDSWVDASQSRVADKNALHSRPSKKSKSEIAPEVTAFTDCENDAAKTTTICKQDPSEEQKTPTAPVCQTDAAALERPSKVSSSETQGHSPGNKVPKVADNEASRSRSPEKSKSENAAEITAFTACKIDAAKETAMSKEYQPQELKTPTSTVYQSMESANEWLSLEKESRSVGVKVSRVADKEALHSRPSKKSKSEIAPEVTAFTDCKNDSAKTTICKQDPSEEQKTPTAPVCQTDAAALERPSKVSSSETQSHSPGNKVPKVTDNEASRPRSPVKLNSENAAEITAFTACKIDASIETTMSKEYQPREPKTPTSTVCQSMESANELLSMEKESPAVGVKVTRRKNARGLKNDTTKSYKRKRRAPNIRQSLKKGNDSNAVETTAEGTNEEECKTEHVVPAVLASAHTETRSPPDTIPCQLLLEGSQTSIYNAGNESNAGETTVEGTNEEECKTEHVVPSVLASAHTGTRSPPDTIPCQLLLEGSHTSICGQNGQGNDPAALVIKESLENNQTEQRESSIELLGPGSKMEISTKSSSQEEIEVHAVAIDGSHMDIDVNQTLPFRKSLPLWDIIESMEVFQSIPQKPHFRPLESSHEVCREGLAIGQMVTFLTIASKIPELRVDMPRSSVEQSLESIAVLETNGFDVKFVRGCLNDLLLKKDKLDLLQNDLKGCESQIVEYKNKRADIDKVVEELDNKLKELRAKREVAVSEREKQNAAIATGQSNLNDIKERMKTIESDFKELTVLPLRK